MNKVLKMALGIGLILTLGGCFGAERDKLEGEKKNLIAEKDALTRENDQLRADNDAKTKQLNDLSTNMNIMATKLGDASNHLNALEGKVDGIRKQSTASSSGSSRSGKEATSKGGSGKVAVRLCSAPNSPKAKSEYEAMARWLKEKGYSSPTVRTTNSDKYVVLESGSFSSSGSPEAKKFLEKVQKEKYYGVAMFSKATFVNK